jgi:hypothetical protein
MFLLLLLLLDIHQWSISQKVAHQAFLEHPSSGTPRVKRLEDQTIIKSLGAIKPKGLNRISKIGYGHLCLREENLRITYEIGASHY